MPLPRVSACRMSRLFRLSPRPVGIGPCCGPGRASPHHRVPLPQVRYRLELSYLVSRFLAFSRSEESFPVYMPRRSRAYGLWRGGRTACVMLAACCGALFCRDSRARASSTRTAGGRSLREGYLRHVHSPWKPTIEGACAGGRGWRRFSSSRSASRFCCSALRLLPKTTARVAVCMKDNGSAAAGTPGAMPCRHDTAVIKRFF